MASEHAKALPRKRFFVEMFTRDVSLEDCVLDLVDNSIDALIRVEKIDLDKALFEQPATPRPITGTIDVKVTKSVVSVKDNCGGITLAKARDEVFNFGHSAKGIQALTAHGIGAYGIGLKRAIFKIGTQFALESVSTGDKPFRIADDLTTWIDKDSKLDDWSFPLETLSKTALDTKRGGTSVTITHLHAPIATLLDNEKYRDQIIWAIRRTYSPFLDRFTRLVVNGETVPPDPIPLGTSNETGFESKRYEDGPVTVRLVAGMAARGPRGEWAMEKAGWYVLCNGRVVVPADKTELTGWGQGILPQFHTSKGRGFVGIASFTSDDPLMLPWTTAKRGLNRESPVFLRARSEMQAIGRPVYKALESLYPSESDSTAASRGAAKSMTQASLAQILGYESSALHRKPATRRRTDLATIKYKVKKTQLAMVQQYLQPKYLTKDEIGLHTFNYFLQQEGLT